MPDASSINPEAGNYPITEDPRELRAAQAAGTRCLQEIPYVAQRYGERGRRFTDSDGAWLCTLKGVAVTRQVFWLGRVLAGRGMPRIVLERHIEILVEELRKAVPGGDYSSLEEAGKALKRERQAHFSEERGQELARAFPYDGSLARLLIAAVADEKAGVVNSVESLMEWLTEAGPREAATALIKEAREA
jgi:hypothetical protein